MRAYVGQKQLPAFFKFQVAGQRKNMKSALALQPNVSSKVQRQKPITPYKTLNSKTPL
jgi:hypothetical protein